MIMCTALLLQGTKGLLCHKNADMYGVTSVRVAMEICKSLYGDSVVPICRESKPSEGKRLFFENGDSSQYTSIRQESEDEFWDRILADAAQQLAEQRRIRDVPRTVIPPPPPIELLGDEVLERLRNAMRVNEIRRMENEARRADRTRTRHLRPTIAGNGTDMPAATRQEVEFVNEMMAEPMPVQQIAEPQMTAQTRARRERREYRYEGVGRWNITRTLDDN